MLTQHVAYCCCRVLLKTVLSATGQSGKLMVTKLNHTNGTSALTTLEMNFPGKTDLTFAMQCMGGSCLKRDELPPQMARHLQGQSLVDQPYQCTGYTIDDLDHGSHGTSRAGICVRPRWSLLSSPTFLVVWLSVFAIKVSWWSVVGSSVSLSYMALLSLPR